MWAEGSGVRYELVHGGELRRASGGQVSQVLQQEAEEFLTNKHKVHSETTHFQLGRGGGRGEMQQDALIPSP